uniref:HAT C-terminal dimerisation domain-containing protein n=1 Tax=Ciona savignyi TaxID=51511 RepID=H2YZK8_CIOSA
MNIDQGRNVIHQENHKGILETKHLTALSLYRLQKTLELKRDVLLMAREGDSVCGLLSEDDWTIAQSVLTLLSPFKTAARRLSKKEATLGEVVPIVIGLLSAINDLEEKSLIPLVSEVADIAKQEMDKKFKDKILENDHYLIASFLHPGYKYSVPTAVLKRIENEVSCRVRNAYEEPNVTKNTEMTDIVDEDSSDPLFVAMSRQAHEARSPATKYDHIFEQVQRYSSTSFAMTTNPYKFWLGRRAHCRELANLALTYLTTPPTCGTAGSSLVPKLTLTPEETQEFNFIRMNLCSNHTTMTDIYDTVASK